MKSKILFIIIAVSLLSSYCFAKDPEYYKKKDTWIATLISSREALTKYEKEIHSRFKLDVEPWYSAGFFKSKPGESFDQKFPPEDNSDLDKQYDNGKFKWVKHVDLVDGSINYFPDSSDYVIYLQRKINSDRDTTIKAYLGSDDGIKVWFNDSLIINHNVNRACRPNDEIANLKLSKGNNKLLLKINNNNGRYGFYFSLFEQAPKELIWSLIERDFSNLNLLTEISWVHNDKIWAQNWNAGDYSEIAKSYADAVKEISPKIFEKILIQASSANNISAMEKINDEYVEARKNQYIILTPKPSPAPKINGPDVYGVRPGSPFLYNIPATGQRPMKFSVEDLPNGLKFDSNTGIITGKILKKGEYIVTFKAENNLGSSEKKFRIVCEDKIALTPPMGWNSWNCFASSVSDKKVRSAAEAMVKSGLINHGWTYINIDDYWETKPGSDDPTLQGAPRDTNGFILPNKRFPDMKALGNFIHSNGLKMGIYSSPGPLTCGGCIASFKHEEQDAQTYGKWGVDYLKYDWCSYEGDRNDMNDLKKPYFVMRNALDKVNRDIVFSLCQYGMGEVWKWGAEVGGNCWRTTGDITDTWQSMSNIAFNQAGHEKYAGPGHWNDPDMLVVGMVGWGENLHPTNLTPDEQYTHISMWCLLSAPLLIGCDMTRMDDFTLNLLTNDEVLAVDQDSLGRQASRIYKNGDTEVWAKDLEDGSKAVGLFNLGKTKTDVAFDFKSIGLKGNCLVRDLWRQKDLGEFKDQFKATVNSHGVVFVKIKNK